MHVVSGGDLITNGVLITGGILVATVRQVNPLVNIKGDLTFDGKGEISFMVPGEEVLSWEKYGILRIDGNVTWNAGTYNPRMNGSQQLFSDSWVSTGTFTIGGAVAVAPEMSNVGDAKQNYRWSILRGDRGITREGDPPAPGGLAPDFDIQSKAFGATKVWMLHRT